MGGNVEVSRADRIPKPISTRANAGRTYPNTSGAREHIRNFHKEKKKKDKKSEIFTKPPSYKAHAHKKWETKQKTKKMEALQTA